MCRSISGSIPLKIQRFIPYAPYNLKCPNPLPIVCSQVFAMNSCQAGIPAGGSGGSWIQAPSADVAGITPSGSTPTDTLCAIDPWRAMSTSASTCKATCFVRSYEQSYYTIWHPT
eukprot:8129933-Pyramimonas_sp.AAC.1